MQTLSKGLDLASRLVSDLYEAINRPDLAGMIRGGEADDFPEIEVVAALLADQAARMARYEAALVQYADPGFWDEATPGGALANHDGGEMARNVLAGRPPFFHRD
ncbi:hypothetical protein [Novosphingobium sp. PhB165]|uniref:hypothetical protein n=1 Tax=Novosphingobium sp. PhB165 TaxID=2485105 RepID=UPI0010534815|nr:hypothetical protein [Novosphingobium sp. PhB165]